MFKVFRAIAPWLSAMIFFLNQQVAIAGPGNQVEVPLPEASPAEAFALAQQAFAKERYREAYFLFEQACKGGQPGGCFNFGLMVDYGVGALENPERALGFYKLACDGKVPEGCRYLGQRLREQETPDQSLALLNFEKACKMGDAESCFLAALMFEQGEGVQANGIQALVYYQASCERGYELGCETLKTAQ